MANSFDLSALPASIDTASVSMGMVQPNNIVSFVPTMPTSPAVITWQTMMAQYRVWWEWFTGQALFELDPTKKAINGEAPYLFPMRLNPIRTICLKHAAALFGEVPDDYDSMVKMDYKDDDDHITPACTKHARRIDRIWMDSNGKEIQTLGGIMGQYLGGSVYKIKYDPLDKSLRYKIRVESIVPDFFLPIYNTANMNELVEAWVMYFIGAEEARSRFGMNNFTSQAGKVLYTEHWTKKDFQIMIGGSVPMISMPRMNGVSMPEGGKNPFGFVPFVYIPHPPRTGSYYGSSHVSDLIGVTKELNARMADVGDYVRDNSESLYWVRNLSSKLDNIAIDEHHSGINLGMKTTLGPQGGDPEIGRLDSAQGSELHMEYIEALLKQIDRLSHMSPVAYGEDVGSQRSGSTYSARMWTLSSHIQQERMHWTQGLRRINWMISQMMLIKGIDGVSEKDVNLRGRIGWFSMFPMDREALVQEAVQRKGVNIISTRGAVEMLSTGIDVDAEVKEIKSDLQNAADLETQVMEAKQTALDNNKQSANN